MNIDNSQTSIEKSNDTEKYQVLITDIHWHKNMNDIYKSKNADDLPQQFALDLPENIINRANKKKNDFNDIVEEFCYNFLTKKFGKEVSYCQVWLPLN